MKYNERMSQAVLCDALFVATSLQQIYREDNDVCKMSFENYTPLHSITFKLHLFHRQGNITHKAL
jgi:hypothetical protein